MDPKDNALHSGLSSIPRNSDDVAKYYDDWADDYDQTIAQWNYDAPKKAAKLLRTRLAPEAVVLDAGCGTGLSGTALRDAGFTTIDGIDVSSASLKVASSSGAYRTVREVDMQQLPLPIDDDEYDGLACVGVLTYLRESLSTLRDFSRVVRPGGAVVVTQRSDLFIEREFQGVLNTLVTDGTAADLRVSDPQPYLPDNDEFSEKILVHYISWTVVQ